MNSANNTNTTTNTNANTPNRETILKAATRYAQLAQAEQEAHFKRSGFTFGTPVVFLDKPGQRYVRVVQATVYEGEAEPKHRAVHSFVDLTNGDVLKSAPWKTPAKHARGNVLATDTGAGALTPYGVFYLR